MTEELPKAEQNPLAEVKRQPLKILMLTSSYPKFPGDTTAPFIEAIAHHIKALGHAVTVVMPYHPDLKRQPLEDGVRLVTYRYTLHKKWNVWGYAASMQGDVKLRKLVYLLLPIVLVSSFLKLWLLTGRARFDIIQAHWVIPNAPVAVLVGKLRRIPVVISLHGSDVYLAERFKPVGWVARWAFHGSAAVTASSPDLLERAQRLGATREPNRSKVIPYGADPQIFSAPSEPRSELRIKLGFASDEALLLCVGRLVYKKGFEFALKAMPLILQTIPNVRLVIAGSGDLDTELKHLARSLGISENVRFEGAVAHNKLPDYLAICDLFLLPSIVDNSGNVDGLPNSLLEALAAGKAVIATNVGGVSLAVKDGENGTLVPQRDAGALAKAALSLLQDPARRERYALAARKKIESELNWAAVARHYAATFYAGLGIEEQKDFVAR